MTGRQRDLSPKLSKVQKLQSEWDTGSLAPSWVLALGWPKAKDTTKRVQASCPSHSSLQTHMNPGGTWRAVAKVSRGLPVPLGTQGSGAGL